MEHSSLNDRDLVSRFCEGDTDAMEVLVNRHKDRLYTYIYMMVKNHDLAEDIFQDTFVKVISSLRKDRYTERGVFVSWVSRIAHNLVIDHFRREKNFRTQSKDEGLTDVFNSTQFSEPTIEDRIILDYVHSTVKELVQELPPEQKKVVELRHYAGLSFREIADQTGVSINTALGRMRYALINLRKLMDAKKLNLSLS